MLSATPVFSRFLRRLPRLLLVLSALPALAASQLRIQDDVLPNAVVGRDYSYVLQGAGGQPPYTYALVAGSLPAGLSLASDKIAGIPTAAGGYFPTIRITDSRELTALRVLSLESLRLEPTNTWCPISQLGGSFSCVGMLDNFSNKNRAVAGSDAGGVFSTQDGGTTWMSEKDFGSLPIADIEPNQCAGGIGFWVITLPSGASHGAIYRDIAGGGSLVNEVNLPAAFTGNRRRIKQRYQSCNGAMLASDYGGGVIFKDSAVGPWNFANTGLPNNGGVFVLDLAYGYGANRDQAVVMALDPGKTFDLYTTTSPGGDWGRCATITANLAQQWRALGLMPDGLIIIGNAFGAVKFMSVGQCAVGGLSNGPRFDDGGVMLTPIVNGFVPSPCYNAGRREVYAYTSEGIFFTPDFDTQDFRRFDHGLLSERVTDLGAADSCGDARLIAATSGHGLAAGTDQGLCQGQTGNDRPVNVNGLAADFRFTSAAGTACTTGVPSEGLYLSSPGDGAFRDGAYGREFFATGETREKVLTGIVTAPRGGGSYVFASSSTGVYFSGNRGISFPSFFPTDEPLAGMAGAPLSTGGAAYGVSASQVYASNAAVPWGAVGGFIGANNATGLDISPGGPLTASASDDEMWVSAGPGGLFEMQFIGGAYTMFLQQGGQIRGVNVRRAAAQQRRSASNYVFAQINEGPGSYRFLRGVKDNSPTSQINFVTAGAGLPADEQANQIVAEPNATAAGYVWVLLPTHGLYLSTDSGANFALVNGSGLPAGYNPLQLSLSRDFSSASNLDDLALLVAGHGVYQSTDGGRTYCFGPAPVNQAPSIPRAIATSTTDSAKILMGTDYGAFYSEDGGASFHSRFINGNAVNAVMFHPGDDAALLGNGAGIYRSPDYGQGWTSVSSGGNVTDFALNSANPAELTATRSAATSLRSTDGGLSWTPQGGAADGMMVDFNASLTLKGGGKTPDAPSSVTAPYWMIGSSSGAAWSSDGVGWASANGTNPDYLLGSVGGNWNSVTTLGGDPSKVLAGNNTYGLYRTLDGGDNWKKVSGAGSGLEASSQVAAALLTSTTSFGNTDALVGMSGAVNGGVYLSGDGGQHWTILNNGFDPNSLNISTLVKTSCGGCPVQYYTGTYGSGVYTRTIAVVAPPAVTSWYFGSTVGSCSTATGCVTPGASCGAETGGQAFKLCGTGFLPLAVVEFDGVPATGCSVSGSTVITCTATPPHFAGAATIKVRNTDTRAGSAAYTYTAGGPRTSGLVVGKSGNNALLSWTCPQASCSAGNPARVYRSQNVGFSLNIEQYSGGASNGSNQGSFTNTGALAAGTYGSYFWNVE